MPYSVKVINNSHHQENMDNWEEDLVNWFNNLNKEIDNFSRNLDQDISKSIEVVGQQVDRWLNQWEEHIDEMSEEVDDLFTETQTFIDEFLDLLIDEELTDDNQMGENSVDNSADILDYLFTDEDYQRKPNPHKHPACVGCTNYHGHSYGGNLLVCAMHPYGWKEGNCPDWEGEQKNEE